MTKDIAILQHAHKQPLYGFRKKNAQFFKSQKYTLEWLNFIKTIFLNQSHLKKSIPIKSEIITTNLETSTI